jgi:DNA-binding transcriptional LysR family regulator
MDTLSGMKAFTKVVEEGSFTAAARALGMPKSTVSRHVAALEDHLGIRLLHRTTRSLRPTDVGQAYYDRASRIVSDVTEAEEAVTQMQRAPRGKLRVTAGVSFGAQYLGPLVAGYSKRYPEVEVEIVLTDRFVDLIDEGFDVAVRAGKLADSSLIARKLGTARMVICGSPAYLEKHGTPRSADDLKGQRCIRYGHNRQGSTWSLRSGVVPLGTELTVNNGDLIKELALADMGLALLPVFIVGEEIGRGRLVQVLPDEVEQTGGVYVVYPHSRHLSAKVRAFVDHCVEACKPEAAWDKLDS